MTKGHKTSVSEARGGTWRFRCQCRVERTTNSEEAAVEAALAHVRTIDPEPPRQQLTAVQKRAIEAAYRAQARPKTGAERDAMAGPGGSYANRRWIKV